MKRKIFMVIGLGVLGDSVARTLAEEGAEVIAVDDDGLLVDQIKEHVDVAVQLDATDPKGLSQLGVQNLDAAIVCIGERFESSVLITANLLDLKVKHVKVRANNPLTESILRRLGAHEVFRVESEMGRMIAHKLHQPAVTREMDLGGGYRIVEWQTPERMAGKTLEELALPRTYGIQVIAIREATDAHSVKQPTAKTVLGTGDQLLLSGHERDLRKLFEGWKPSKE